MPEQASPSQSTPDFRLVVYGTMAIAAVVLPAMILLQHELLVQGSVVLVAIETLGLGSLWLHARGQRQVASWILVGGLLFLVSLAAVRAGGVHSPGVAAFFVFSLVAWLLLGERAGLITAAACMLIGLGFALAEVIGALPTPVVNYHPVTLWAIYCFYIGIFVVLARLATRSLTRALNDAQSEIAERGRVESEREEALVSLRERVKEMRLMQAATLLLRDRPFDRAVLTELVAMMPAAWFWPECCVVRIRLPGIEVRSPGWRETPWVMSAAVTAISGNGTIDVAYTEERPPRGSGPFLTEEVALLASIAEMLGGFINRDAGERQRHEAEQRIGESESRFRSLSENAIVGVYIVQEGVFTYVNPAMEHVSGRTRDELLGLAPAALVHPDDRALVEEQIRKRVAGEARTVTYEVRIPRKDGGEARAEVMGTGLVLGGKPALMGYLIDVTARRQAEAELAASETRFRSLIEQAPTAVGISRDGITRYVNKRYLELFGHPSDAEILGHPLIEQWAPASRPLVIDHLRRRAAGLDAPIRYEGIGLRKDGTEFPLHAEVGRVQLPDGPASLGFLTDVSDRVKLEGDFRQAQKMEAIGRLAGGVAHDFNNLLTIMGGSAQLLLEEPGLSPAHRALAKEIVDSGLRAADLTRQLLAFSRRQILDPRPLNVNDVVTGVEKMLRRLVHENVAVVTTLAPDVELVLADPGQLEQVIINLAVNARDAMLSGGTLTLETACVTIDQSFAREHADAVPGRYVRLTARDTGVGMSPLVKSRIFEPFFTTKEEGKGTGLGLATVYGIVKQSNGFITVTSDPGHGATFDIYLPVSKQAALAPEDEPAASGLVRGYETVLVAEDSESVRQLVAQVLASCGYRVLQAENGVEALNVARDFAGPIDLLLTDVVMPGMGGQELAGRLVSERPRTKVLYMTGYTDDPGALMDDVHHGAALIQKPMALLSLSQKVREALGPPLRSSGEHSVVRSRAPA